jgi:hypothetical protein
VNFDLSIGITAVGGVNVVTRSGGNDFHGSGYFFFRDHNMAAKDDPSKNKLFYFFNCEYRNRKRRSLLSQPGKPNNAPNNVQQGRAPDSPEEL